MGLQGQVSSVPPGEELPNSSAHTHILSDYIAMLKYKMNCPPTARTPAVAHSRNPTLQLLTSSGNILFKGNPFRNPHLSGAVAAGPNRKPFGSSTNDTCTYLENAPNKAHHGSHVQTTTNKLQFFCLRNSESNLASCSSARVTQPHIIVPRHSLTPPPHTIKFQCCWHGDSAAPRSRPSPC